LTGRVSYLRRKYHRPGTAPGTYDVAETRQALAGAIDVIDYSADEIRQRSGLPAILSEPHLASRWIRVHGAPSLDVLDALREQFDIDPLALEDVVHQGQRPKFTDFDPGVFITLAVPGANGVGAFRQLSLYMTNNLLITFIEHEDGLFAPIDERMRKPGGRLRKRDIRYLMYAVLDLAIDLLFPLIDQTAQRLEDLESAIISEPSEALLLETHGFRSRLLVTRKVAWATREVVNELLRHLDDDSDFEIRPYLQDAHDHIVSAIDLVETQRDIATNLVEVYLSVMSNRMNDVIKLLTIIATLFIPPTFLVGLYGMNFDRDAGPLSMPELGWPLGYVGVVGFIFVCMIGMLAYFRHRGWL